MHPVEYKSAGLPCESNATAKDEYAAPASSTRASVAMESGRRSTGGVLNKRKMTVLEAFGVPQQRQTSETEKRNNMRVLYTGTHRGVEPSRRCNPTVPFTANTMPHVFRLCSYLRSFALNQQSPGFVLPLAVPQGPGQTEGLIFVSAS